VKLQSTRIFDEKFRELVRKNKRLFIKAQKRIEIFSLNQNYPSLRLHKLSGSMKGLWSFSVDESVRIVFYYKDRENVVFVDIGKHEEVYKR
jgi:mRNA-degrading endonuclease YafQ of YafQ-DinJ toxin-antitoxin module